VSKAASQRPPPSSQSPQSGAHAGPASHFDKLTSPTRLAALGESKLMDAPSDAAFDRFTRLAAKWLGVPVALISLVDDHRQFFKSAVGLREPWASKRETPLTHSFCQYAVTTAEPLVVMDARQHPWLKDNLAISELGVIAYAGIPLVTSDEEVLGVLCVIDVNPRPWSAEDIDMLRELAAMVSTEIDLRARVRALTASEAARDQDHALLRSVLDCMEDSVVVTNPDGQVILSNQAAQRARPGAVMESADSVARHGIFLADGTTPLLPASSPAQRALRGELVRDAQLVRRQPGLPDEFHSVNSSPIRDASGAITAAVSVGRDVTQANAAREALAQSEALFRTVVRNLPNGAVLLFDRDLRYLMADGEQLLASMGFTTRDLLGKTPYDVVAGGRAEAVANRYRTTLAGTVSEFEVVRGSKTYAATVVPVHDDRGEVIAGMALVYDVTVHKQLQDQLRRQTLVFQSTLEHMREGVVVVSAEGEYAVFNQAAKSFFDVRALDGSIPDALETLRFFDEDETTPLDTDEHAFARALRGEVPFPTDVVVRAGKTGAATHLHVTIDRILDGQSAPLGSVAVLHDVTAQRSAERSAREQRANVELLQAIAVAANNAQAPHDAFQVALGCVCQFMNWQLGHVYLKHGETLKSSGWWHSADPARFVGFREASAVLEFSTDKGMIGDVLGSGLATWWVNLEDHERFLRASAAAQAGIVSGFAFPVLIEDEVVAVLEFYSERLEEADLRLLGLMTNIGTQLGRVIERDRSRQASEAQAERVRSLAIRDELTCLHNRRGFLELARQHLRLAERAKRSAVLFFFDLDGMKPINDELGHEEGDHALREIADVLRNTFRGSDILGRLGGDEFVALLPDADASQVALFVSRVQAEITKRNALPDRKYALSVSIGGCTFDPGQPEPIEELLVKADALMYEQKRAYRKRHDASNPGAAPSSRD
jgi:diguanylate cyclase (GGDEF)-like protein/PAS domain S-box-containing protein